MRSVRLAAIFSLLTALVANAEAAEPWQNDYIVFGRGTALWRTDPRGKAAPKQIVALPKDTTAADVTSLKTDAGGRVLLIEVASKWYWIGLSSSTVEPAQLQQLPCSDGPAEIASDGSAIVCASAPRGALIVKVSDGLITKRNVAPQGARLVKDGDSLDVVWADKHGIWRSPVDKPKQIIKIAQEAPLHDFSVSPDGSRAVGYYQSGKDGAILFGFALDGIAARRKGIRTGIPRSWTHDGQWLVVQEGTSACLMRTLGGQYKCWKGYVAVGAASDGKWALMAGTANAASDQAATAPKGKKKDAKSKSKDKKLRGKKVVEAAPAPVAPAIDATVSDPLPAVNSGEEPHDEGGEDGTSGVQAPGQTAAALSVGKGVHSLYRGTLDGAFTDPPALIVHDVAGAAVWVPGGDGAAAPASVTVPVPVRTQ
jgi:hypothetical protein